jgi:hypothetical protein
VQPGLLRYLRGLVGVGEHAQVLAVDGWSARRSPYRGR